MTPIILYFLKVNIALAVLYIMYKLAFTKDTFLNLRRFILLAICVVSVTYPFIRFDVFNNNIESLDTWSLNVLLPELAVSAEADISNKADFNWLSLLVGIYIVGVIIFLFRSFMEVSNIAGKVLSWPKEVISNVTIHRANEKTEPYSFFKWICISPDWHTKDEIEAILIHEYTHAKEWHSLDIVIVQLLIIVNWFNPFVWLLRSEMKINHEYLADRKVIHSGYNKKIYQYHLIGLTQTPYLAAANLYNNFSVLPLKNRLKMLNKKTTPGIMVSKYLMFIPVLLMLLVFSNCQNTVKEEPIAKEEPVAIENPDTRAETTPPAEVTEDEQDPENVVFEIVENMPEFPGGYQALVNYLQTNIKYPAKAIEDKIEGRAIIELIVEKDGSVIAPKLMKSSESAILDKEALRVMSNMPKWTPGKQRGVPVRVKYMVPVKFVLPK